MEARVEFSANLQAKWPSVRGAADILEMRGNISGRASPSVRARTAIGRTCGLGEPGSELLKFDGYALARMIAKRDVSCVEVCEERLDHIQKLNPKFNAIVSLRTRDEILVDAREKDALLSQGVYQGWLHGLPLAIKDLAATRGLRTTQGSPILRDAIPSRDAPFVQRMKQAGAVVIGKTNTAEFGLGCQTYNSVFGATYNAYAAGRTSGGSSGGAAVAVATRMLPVADGSDFAGSLRNPAAYGNVFSFRPAPGRIPGEAHHACLPSMGSVGPIARTVQDLAMLLAVQDGDDRVRSAASLDGPALSEALRRDMRGKRIGWLGDFGGHLPFEPGVLELCEGALRPFADIGCTVEAATVDYSMEQLWETWIALRAWLAGGTLAPRYRDPAQRALMKEEACWEVEQALRLSAMDVYEASTRRAAWRRSMEKLFERFDFLILPGAQCFPFDADVAWPGKVGGRQMDTYHRWMEVYVPATMAGCPTLTAPAGFSPQGLPMGIQILARWDDDIECLRLARAYEDATAWARRHPPCLESPSTC
jgi:amidase